MRSFICLAGAVLISACGGAEAPPPTPAEVRAQQEAARLASEIESAVSTVTAVVPGSPPLYEGTPLSLFTSQQVRAYCGMPWDTRISASGRTEYNPCRRKDAFSVR